MPDTITDDRAAEIAAMTVPDLTAALDGLDLPSLEMALRAEEAKGDAVRSTAIGAITAAMVGLVATDPVPPATTLYTPPRDTAGITFSTGRVLSTDDDGFVGVPDNLSFDERNQLTRAGFVPA